MSAYDDLTRLGSENLIAAGWLSRDRPFAKGDVEATFAESLAALAADPWQPSATAGLHHCAFCRFSGGPGSVRIGEHMVRIGADLVLIPDGARCWVAPTMIVHYVDAHEYRPPHEFVVAVSACPPMRSMPYLRALRDAGITKDTAIVC